ncbi:MAG TPA: LysR family transcriptional regulator [Acetobacteraceae bacterium]|jgi:DNA-binding transcriptional LysR family regulator|nr:LysR family transcriptional regulator [Acetobacteraceae bacterium]
MRHMRIWRYVDEVAKAGSLRQAAERLNVTASALQRRIQDVEADLGTALFDRLPSGMRLTAAGEAFIRWIRTQAADLERVQSQIADLSGLRRGVVRIACSQALAAFFLPREVARFSSDHPLVHFAVSVTDHIRAVTLLREYEADIALVFQPDRYPDFEPLMAIGQRLMAIMAADHPLASRDTLRLRDCADYPLALLDRGFGGREIADRIMDAGSVRFDIGVEANSSEFLRNYVAHTRAITLQIELGALPDLLGPGLKALPIDDRDEMHGSLVLGQLRGRNLPVAAARFADQVTRRLDRMRTLPLADFRPR